ncbi:hypothetical protein Xen7305DRAFT_00018500 [Xenococcus sp. PCC 7305]|uniref:vWA domain-containing protein n=1 Tax=Xenococcus sp. PCC 7305 TaxID=102125 RepID=UPI0002ABEE60|nr:vWA domain-containing protein [Xenococcus sp. PCC 7305]ELS02139.1 hypothetical protein Xen7305DRAFT_00018500 [Xenococcus sp. PCC 7305]
MHNKKILGLKYSLVLLAANMFFAQGANADSLTPDNINKTVKITKSISINRTVTLDATPELKVDVLFLSDNTGSMGSAITNVQNNATTLLNNLVTTYGDIEIGVAHYFSDPAEGDPSGYGAGYYHLLEPVAGGNQADAIAAINNWVAPPGYGYDWPEANLFALHQAATSGDSTASGIATNYDTQWRADAQKVIVWFGDAPSHTSTVDVPETIQALQDENIKVVAINILSSEQVGNNSTTLDNNGDQASVIASQTGGIYEDVYPNSLATKIEQLVDQVIKPSSLSFTTVGDTSGLTIDFVCTDSLGCSDVLGGESRDFRMDITGIIDGIYEFETLVQGASGAVGDDKVTVIGHVYAD